MQHKTLYFTILALIPGLLATSPTQADVEHRQLNSRNAITYVSNDSWQPEDFDNGTTIPAAHALGAKITLDGKDNEPEWGAATEVEIPLYYGSVKNASFKALYNNDEVFIRVRWQDSTQDRDHHPWVWDEAQDTYVAGPQVEDSVLLSFEAGCEWSPSFLEGYVYDFDAWHWMAARTDPSGQALDIYGSMQDRDVPTQKFTKYKTRNTEDVWNLKFIDKQPDSLNSNWDELDRAYMFQPIAETVYYRGDADWDGTSEYATTLAAPDGPPADPAEVFPQFSPVKLEGGSAEVSAKGHWEDGYWTVEFRRDRLTPARAMFDTVFNRLTQFSIYVFDHVEGIDEGSESGRLFLRFLPEEQILVKD